MYLILVNLPYLLILHRIGHTFDGYIAEAPIISTKKHNQQKKLFGMFKNIIWMRLNFIRRKCIITNRIHRILKRNYYYMDFNNRILFC